MKEANLNDIIKNISNSKIWKTDLDNIPIQYGVKENYEDTLGYIQVVVINQSDKFNLYIKKSK